MVIEFGQTREITHFAFPSREMTGGSSTITGVQLRFNSSGADIVVALFETPESDLRHEFALPVGVEVEPVRVEAVTTIGGNMGARKTEFLGP
ncbi:MAG: hypothetical protein ACJAYU_004777 [Bradymonadia bacterium]